MENGGWRIGAVLGRAVGGGRERKIGDTLRKFPRNPFREKTVSPKGTPIFEVYYSRKIDIDKRLSDKV